MLKLQTEHDPRTGIKVLTCYLLPQSSSQQSKVYYVAKIRSVVIKDNLETTDILMARVAFTFVS